MLGDTLLHVATRAGQTPAVLLLLERGANPLVKNAMLDMPLQIAMKRNHTELSLLLMKYAKRVAKGTGPQPRKVLSNITSRTTNDSNAREIPRDGDKDLAFCDQVSSQLIFCFALRPVGSIEFSLLYRSSLLPCIAMIY